MSPGRQLLALVGATLAIGLVLLTAVQVLAPQRDGLLALSQILAPYLFLLLVPFLLFLRTPGPAGRLFRWSAAAALLVFAIRFLPTWIPLPGAAPAAAANAGPPLPVASWNLELGQPQDRVVTDTLAGMDAAVVGLVELTPHHADAIAADPRLRDRFRTMVLRPVAGSLGIGLLSTLPAVGRPRLYHDPPILVQRLDAGNGRTLTVVVAHPLPATITSVDELIPLGYDSTPRDRHLNQVRGIVDPILERGDPLLLIGDFNVVDREPAYADLARGLIDAQRAVGLGPGHTWRPPRLEWLPFGLLRIDYLFTGNGVTPVATSPDCTPRGSDHCIITGTVVLPAAS